MRRQSALSNYVRVTEEDEMTHAAQHKESEKLGQWTPYDCKDSQTYDAYRIRMTRNPTGVYQRHEWRTKDGVIECEEWISSSEFAFNTLPVAA
jgi:hypothetical protein